MSLSLSRTRLGPARPGGPAPRPPLLSSLPPAWPRASPGRGARQGEAGSAALAPSAFRPPPEPSKSQSRKPKCGKGIYRSRNAYMLVYRLQSREKSLAVEIPGEAPAFSPNPQAPLGFFSHPHASTARARGRRTHATPEAHKGGSSPSAAWFTIWNRHVPVWGRFHTFGQASWSFGLGRCLLPSLSWAFLPF